MNIVMNTEALIAIIVISVVVLAISIYAIRKGVKFKTSIKIGNIKITHKVDQE